VVRHVERPAGGALRRGDAPALDLFERGRELPGVASEDDDVRAAAASCLAVASPIPLEPPVRNTFLPPNSFTGSSLLVHGRVQARSETLRRTDRAARVPGRDRPGGDRPGDDAPRADHGVLADADAGQHDDAATEPGPGADRDGLRPLRAARALLGVPGMIGSEQLDARPQLDVVASVIGAASRNTQAN